MSRINLKSSMKITEFRDIKVGNVFMIDKKDDQLFIKTDMGFTDYNAISLHLPPNSKNIAYSQITKFLPLEPIIPVSILEIILRLE